MQANMLSFHTTLVHHFLGLPQCRRSLIPRMHPIFLFHSAMHQTICVIDQASGKLSVAILRERAEPLEGVPEFCSTVCVWPRLILAIGGISSAE